MGALFDLMLGAVLVSNIAISMAVLPIYVGFGMMFRSMMAVGTSIELRHYHDKHWSWFLVIGIIGVVFAVMLIWDPFFAGLTIVAWTGFSFIVIGIFRIFLAFRLRKLHHFHPHMMPAA